MHILLIHQAFAALDEPGGTRHHEFARFLAARGQRVTVITSRVSYLTGATISQIPDSRGSENNSGQGDVRVIRAASSATLHGSFIQKVFAFVSFMVASFFTGLAVKKVDVVWGTSPPIFQGFTAWLLARLKGVPFLFEVRDLWPQFAIAVGVLKNPLLIRLSIWLERFLYRHADLVMVNSPAYVSHVRERGARRVELVPNGADPGMFDPADEGKPFRARNRLTGKYVVLYAGAHGLSNDLGVVLDSAVLLKEDSPQVMLVLLGDGKEKPTLQTLAGNKGLTNVLFLPPIPKMEMAAALAGANACLAILKPLEEYKTTYPNKVFDYMAAGRPVVLAIDGVIRSVVESAGCGIFAQPGDPAALAEAVRSLASDPERGQRMGLDGRKYLEQHFSRTIMSEKILDILNNLTR